MKWDFLSFGEEERKREREEARARSVGRGEKKTQKPQKYLCSLSRTEVFDPDQNRWIHADPCEAIADEPLLYEVGWSKKPARAVLAFSAHPGDSRVSDVTLRYTRLRGVELEENRRQGGSFDGEALEGAVARAGVVIPGGSGLVAAAAAQQRRAADEAELLSGDEKANKKDEDKKNSASSLPARTAGDAEWIRARGEAGKRGKEEEEKREAPPPCSSAPSAPSPSPPPSAAEEEDFASQIRREFDRLRVAEPELAPNEAAVRALAAVTKKAK